MPVSLAQFEQRLQRGELAPVYLLAGAEDLLRLEAADAVRAAAKAQGFSEREVFEAGAGFDWDQLHASMGALSLFASRRLLDLRLPTGKPGKDGAALIEAFCAQPPPDLCLLITAQEWSRQHEAGWSRAIDQVGCLLPLSPLKAGEFPGWLARRLRSRRIDADQDAMAVLAERTEGNLLAAAQEVDKLALLAAGQRLDARTMNDLVADSARFDVFGLTEAAMAGEAARALRILRGLRAEGEQVVPVMNWVAAQVQILAQLAELQASGGNLAAAMQQARIWESRQAAYRKTLQRLGSAGCARLLAACSEVDRASKGRADGDPWILLERILLALAQPRALSLLEAV